IEIFERAIRSSGRATVVSPGSQGCLSDASSCLQLQIIAGSVEHRLNPCYYTYYAWYEPTATTNGRLVRYGLAQNLSTCTASPDNYDIFDVDTFSGASIERAGADPLFTVV